MAYLRYPVNSADNNIAFRKKFSTKTRSPKLYLLQCRIFGFRKAHQSRFKFYHLERQTMANFGKEIAQ